MSDPVVQLESGTVRGLVENHEDGFCYYSFKGIPYGEPPVGDLRFEDPVPIKKWSGTLDCTNYGPLCCQFEFITQTAYFEENCLHLNVYTRTINEPNVKKAVMIWIPFGNYTFGDVSDAFCGPDYLIRKDVVLITVNFRLGILGFLNLEDEVAPGNQGFKDLVLALKWVQENIQMFGGDPNNVTVCGNAQGGSASHYLALSPLSKGLVHKVICQSGAVYNSWATVVKPRENVIKFCSLLGKDLTDSKEIKAFLKTVSTTDIVETSNRLWTILDYKPFGPGIDSKSSNPFMTIHRFVAADQGFHIPCLVGHNNRDGTIALTNYFSAKGMTKKEFFEMGNKDFGKILLFNAMEILGHYNLDAAKTRRLYYKSAEVSESNADKFADYATDVHVHQGTQRLARVQTEQSSAPIYLYRFNYESPQALSHCFTPNAPPGTGLGDELPYLFKMGIFEQFGFDHLKKGTQSYRIMEQMTEMWTNFAIYGRPTIETSELLPILWKPVSDGTLLRYMSIDEDLTMQYTVNVEQKYISASQIRT